MRILIIEDNDRDLKNLIKNIDLFFKYRSCTYEIEVYQNNQNLLESLKSYDLIFLDVELGDENGIEVAMKIREVNQDIRIIITSNHIKYSIEGYKVQANRYFVKPIKQDDFDIELNNVLSRYLQDFKGFIDERISKQKIYYNTILYIEIVGRKTQINFLNGDVLISPYSIKKWLNDLHNLPFVQIHKSFIINLNHTRSFMNKEVFMVHGDPLPLSRHYKSEFVKAYMCNLHSR